MTQFTGAAVRLTALRPEEDAKMYARWDADTQYRRLLDSDPPRNTAEAQIKKEMEAGGLPDGKGFGFSIRTLADDRLLGFVYLGVISWIHRDAWLGIGLGDREYWGKGYGTDAMRVALRYAFEELALHRVTLNVFANNERARRSYEKAGFKFEGRLRQAMLRDGQRLDIIYMGILREDWMPSQT